MPLRISKFCAIALLLCASGAVHAKRKEPPESFASTPVPVAETAPPNGAIFQAEGYAALTSGTRASRLGDVLTITLLERTSAGIVNSTGTDRAGNIGLSPPSTGPLSLISSSDINMGGDQSFKGKGNIVQSNSLTGEISVTIAAVYPNGTMLVKGEKRLALNRGDETVQFSGIVRSADITADNRVPSWRVADARIAYRGKGDVARASRQGWLQRFFSVVSPF